MGHYSTPSQEMGGHGFVSLDGIRPGKPPSERDPVPPKTQRSSRMNNLKTPHINRFTEDLNEDIIERCGIKDVEEPDTNCGCIIQ